jgi:TonB family protein
MGLNADSGPKLLLDWQEETTSVRWFRAGMASILVHAVFVPLLVLVASMDTPTPKVGTLIVSNLHHITLLTPRDLTQKEPNRAKLAKEVNVEDLMPRPATAQRLPPAPAVRIFKPPTPKTGPPEPGPSNLAEPPKIETAANVPKSLPMPAGTPNAPPPKIQPDEQPKLALEAPGQHGTNPDASKTPAKLAPPKAAAEEATREVARGGGSQSSIVPGDVGRPTLPESPQLPPSPGRAGSALELLSDPMGVDFKPYLAQVLALVRHNWFAVIPESAYRGNRGLTILEFEVDREGGVPKLVIANTSGSQVLDKAAVAAISATASERFPPLPRDFKGLAIRLRLAFKYNMQ